MQSKTRKRKSTSKKCKHQTLQHPGRGWQLLASKPLVKSMAVFAWWQRLTVTNSFMTVEFRDHDQNWSLVLYEPILGIKSLPSECTKKEFYTFLPECPKRQQNWALTALQTTHQAAREPCARQPHPCQTKEGSINTSVTRPAFGQENKS